MKGIALDTAGAFRCNALVAVAARCNTAHSPATQCPPATGASAPVHPHLGWPPGAAGSNIAPASAQMERDVIGSRGRATQIHARCGRWDRAGSQPHTRSRACIKRVLDFGQARGAFSRAVRIATVGRAANRILGEGHATQDRARRLAGRQGVAACSGRPRCD